MTSPPPPITTPTPAGDLSRPSSSERRAAAIVAQYILDLRTAS
jgi:hypothetical protein